MAAITVFILIIFLCVLLHEYGHALTARRYGVNTRDIILSPIGGVARLEKIPEKPTNLLLVVFNLIPAFPMDGGRVLRSILAMKMSRVKATKIAFIVAQIAALIMFLVGLYASHYVLCFIAVFVVLTSRVEWKSVNREAALAHKTVRDLMQPISQKVYSDQSIQEVLGMNPGHPKNYLIFNRDEEVIGVLFHQFLQHAVKEKDLTAPVEKYKSHTWEKLPVHFPMGNAIAIFQKRGYGILPVVEDGQIIGELDMIHINQFVKNI